VRALTATALVVGLMGGAGVASAAPASSLAVETAANRQVVQRFAELFYRQHRVRQAFQAYVASDYVQHSPGADGRDAAIAALKPMFARPNFTVQVRRVLVDGDMATVMIHAEHDGKAAAIVDLFRLKGGKIVEHWDVNEQITTPSTNPHPLF
jgi:predicted SnoaL-like aldol condensation-catalyzing enzyme